MIESFRKVDHWHRRARRVGILILSAPIHAYRHALSPFLPASCRFAPSCSAYALEALAVHGPVKGGWLALRRLSRCHPIRFFGGSSGYDPVPKAESSRKLSPERP